MKTNPIRESSAVGEAWLHCMLKVKYCHKIFDDKDVREECARLFHDAEERYSLRIDMMGFDNNHVHMKIDIRNYSRPQVAKMLKGYVAKKLFQRFPGLKKKFFWGSGLWNPSYYLGNIPNMQHLHSYIRGQKYGDPSQRRLGEF